MNSNEKCLLLMNHDEAVVKGIGRESINKLPLLSLLFFFFCGKRNRKFIFNIYLSVYAMLQLS